MEHQREPVARCRGELDHSEPGAGNYHGAYVADVSWIVGLLSWSPQAFVLLSWSCGAVALPDANTPSFFKCRCHACVWGMGVLTHCVGLGLRANEGKRWRGTRPTTWSVASRLPGLHELLNGVGLVERYGAASA